MRLVGDWQVATVLRSGAELGWVGTGSSRLAHDASVCVVLDGRIHNGADFSGFGSDAEIFLDLYRRLGFEGAMRAVNADIAVALYDETADRLWLGRDRLGIKPAYWAVTRDGGVAVASQPRGVLAVEGMNPAVDRAYVARVAGSHYRTFDNDQHGSPFEAISQLPAGHVLEAGPNGASVRRYWDLEDAPDYQGDDIELAARCRDLLADAVRLRLGTAGRPAFLLSGGMDSSSVVASAVAVSGKKQHAFSSLYEDATYDESHEIRSMLQAAVEEWHPVLIDQPDVYGTVRKLVALHDEPVATATWLSHWVLSNEARHAGFETLFGGMGGDELNAGEYEYFVFHFADLRAQGREVDLAHEVEQWAKHHDHPIFRKNRSVMEADLLRRVDTGVPGWNRPDMHRLLRYVSVVRPEWYDLNSFVPAMDHPFTSHLKNRSYQDLFRETTPCCLRAEDRHAAALGMEHSDPFLDYRLVELMFRVPGDRKIRDGITKRLLREAMRNLLPDATRERIKKTGWNAPAHVWFAGDSAEPLAELIHSDRFADRGIYDVSEVHRLFAEHQRIVESGEQVENHMMFFWQLVNLEAWFEWMDEPPW